MTQDIATTHPLNFEGQPVRIREIEGETWWVLMDVCAAIGIDAHRVAKGRLHSDDVCSTSIIDDLGRPQQTSMVNESGLYDLVFLSRKPEAKRFKRWITKEVLPSIRQTGIYARSDAELAVLMREYADRLEKAAKESGKSLSIEAIIADMQPKVVEWDTFLDTHGLTDLGALAQALGGGRQRLIDRLRDLNVLVSKAASQGGVRPTQEYVELGWFEVKMVATNVGPKHETYATPKGVSGVFRALVKHGLGGYRWGAIPDEAQLFERLEFAKPKGEITA